MKKRLMTALAAGALVAAMLPGAVSAYVPDDVYVPRANFLFIQCPDGAKYFVPTGPVLQGYVSVFLPGGCRVEGPSISNPGA